SKRFAHQFFVDEWAISLRRIEERHAAFDGCPNERNHLLLVGWRAISRTHSHAAQSESRDFETPFSEFALFHVLISYLWAVPQPWYCSSLTFSIQSAVLPSRFSTIEMWVMAVAGAAPCQCFSPGAIQTTSPGRISSTGPPQRCAQPMPSVTT